MSTHLDVDSVNATAFGLAEDFETMDSPWHSHGLHQILFAAEGTLHLFVPDGQWLLPPQRAAWISAGVRHRVESNQAQLRTVYLSPFITGMPQRDCCVFAVGPLAREMILASMEWGPDRDPEDELAEHFFGALALFCHRWTQKTRPYHLPRAQSPELERAMNWMLQNLSESPTLSQAAEKAGLSTRTLARRFKHEAQTSYRTFLRSARLLRAMEILSKPNNRVTDAAFEVGFESLAAFTRAFTAFTGELPRDYRARIRSG